jgi:hypothetical protein
MKQYCLTLYSDPIRIVKGFRRKSFSQSPFTIHSFTSHLGLLYVNGMGFWAIERSTERLTGVHHTTVIYCPD